MKRWMLFLIVAVFATIPALVLAQGAVELPQTGQKQCYDTSGTVIDCPTAGQTQDGAMQAGVAWPDPRFTDNEDGTVTDNLTGLIWLQNTNCFGTRTWADTLSDANGLADGTCGLNDGSVAGDWSLPNIVELESLVHAGFNEEDCSGSPCGSNTEWLNTQGFVNVQVISYWSGTSYADFGHSAWIVSMWDGYVSAINKSTYYNVWPVRESLDPSVIALPRTGQTTSYATGDDRELQRGVAWPDPKFNDNGDGTVTDNLTGLMWLQNANCMFINYPLFDNDDTNGDGRVTWQHALDFVDGINYGTYPLCDAGYNDWRIPNRKELFSLEDFSHYHPALQSGHPFENVQSNYSWSGTSLANNTDDAGIFSMWVGYVAFSNKPYYYYVWPVRAGQVGPSVNSDIAVTKSDGPDPVSTGAELTYSISVTNNGPDDATGVRLTDTLPGSVTFVSATSSQGSCSEAGDVVTCDIGDMANSASADVTIIVTSPDAEGTITNTATVDCTSNDPVMSNNTVIEYTIVQSPEPSIEETIDFFDQAVEDGTITGSAGWIWGQIQLNIMMQHLTRARDAIDRGAIGAACWRLRRAYLGCDGEGYDWVMGEDAEELSQMIYDLAVSLDCWWTRN